VLRKNIVLLAIAVVVLIGVLGCSSESVDPTTIPMAPTSIQPPSTPTPVPTLTSTPAPTLVPVPTSTPQPSTNSPNISVAELSSVEYLSTLPPSELNCLVDAIGGEERAILLSQKSDLAKPVTNAEISSLVDCLSVQTILSLPLGDVADFLGIPKAELKLIITASQMPDVAGTPEPTSTDPTLRPGFNLDEMECSLGTNSPNSGILRTFELVSAE